MDALYGAVSLSLHPSFAMAASLMAGNRWLFQTGRVRPVKFTQSLGTTVENLSMLETATKYSQQIDSVNLNSVKSI
jgi:hypothetical protein